MYKMASLKLQYYWHYGYHKSDKLQAKVLFTFWATNICIYPV